MCYLHSVDLLHGDLTGSNILLSSSDVDSRGFIGKVSGRALPWEKCGSSASPSQQWEQWEKWEQCLPLSAVGAVPPPL